jgi:signal transduction histidine kinase
MAEALRVLFVEDSSDDAELETIQLRKAGFDVTASRVWSAADLHAAIDGPWQVIIADYNMPDFTGLDALAIWRERRPDIPFILVSGTLGEERAVGALQAGAHDYLMKDNLRRLGPAVVRALRETEVQRQRERAARAESFLARASAVLGEGLNHEAAAKGVAELAVPEIADGCVVDILDPSGALQPVALVYADPARAHVAQQLRRRYPPAPEGSEEAQLIRQINDETLAAMAGDADQLALLRQLELVSSLAVPVRARGAVLGLLTLVSCRPQLRYDEIDRAFAEELARRLGFAVDNARLYSRTQEAVRLREDFLAVASHELRTPLTTLQLQLQSLLAAVAQGKPTIVHPRDEAKLERAVRSTEKLSDLVDTLVDVSRIASGHLPLSRVSVDLNATTRKVVERFAEESQRVSSPVMIHDGAPITGHWDRERVEQMLGNLLSNALKYGAGQPIDIDLLAHEGWAEITVRDRGMGIAPADLERIFGRFERAVSVRNYGGLGLGLYLTREIAQSHGGSIHAESAPGQGSAFTIRLPHSRAPAAPAIPD